jgi:uncharacterized protein YwqG
MGIVEAIKAYIEKKKREAEERRKLQAELKALEEAIYREQLKKYAKKMAKEKAKQRAREDAKRIMNGLLGELSMDKMREKAEKKRKRTTAEDTDYTAWFMGGGVWESFIFDRPKKRRREKDFYDPTNWF